MTAQEAIKSLEVLKALVEWGEPMEYQVALDMAIEALCGQRLEEVEE